MRQNVAIAVTTAALAICACGGPDSSSRTPERDRTQTSVLRYGTAADKTAPYGKPASQEPRVRIPSGPAPDDLVVRDLRPGTGPRVARGDVAIVNYVGYHYATRRQYDTSYGLNPRPYEVIPGAGHLIEGFEEGIVGMRVGGRRQLTIPPAKAYGDRGLPGQVRPGETLVFVVDLEAVERR